MEKRIGVSLSACQALAPHAEQMLLITLVVLAGPVWVSVMREAACNPVQTCGAESRDETTLITAAAASISWAVCDSCPVSVGGRYFTSI